MVWEGGGFLFFFFLMGGGGEVLFFSFVSPGPPFFSWASLGEGGLVGCIRFDLRNRDRERVGFGFRFYSAYQSWFDPSFETCRLRVCVSCMGGGLCELVLPLMLPQRTSQFFSPGLFSSSC